MKKQLVSITVALCLIFTLTASRSFAQLKLGVLGGVNFNNMSGDKNSDGMLLGYHLGASVNLRITNSLSLEPQVLYSTKGGNYNKGDIELNYFEVPVWLRYQLESGLNLNAGAYAGFLSNAKIGDQTAKDDFTKTDFGLGFGIGYQVAIGLGLALNYNMGISNVGEDYEILGQTYSYDAKNNSIKLTASYAFGGRRESK